MDWLSDLLKNWLSTDGVSTSWFGAILVAYLGGVVSSFTPCIYPMIPITLSMVGGISPEKRTWRSVVTKTLVYIAGMSVVYAMLGVASGYTGKIFGSFTNTTGWYLALGIILTGAALWMMDVIEWDPQAFLDRVLRPKVPKDPSKQTQGYANAFILGATSGFIAAPCTTPVLASILAYIARSQSVEFGFVLMLAFSFGLGTLLLAIALSASLLERLPRSGAWMKKVKVGSGVLLLLFAEYLIFRAGEAGGLK